MFSPQGTHIEHLPENKLDKKSAPFKWKSIYQVLTIPEHISLSPLKLMNFSQYPHPQIYFRTLFVGLIQTNHIPHSPFLVPPFPFEFHITAIFGSHQFQYSIPQYCHVDPFYFFGRCFSSAKLFFLRVLIFGQEMGEYLIYLCMERC